MINEPHTNGASQDELARAFDLVELIEPVGFHDVGERGTVVVEGIDRALVSFAWREDSPSSALGGDVPVEVMHRGMRVVRHRSYREATSGTSGPFAPTAEPTT